MCGMAFRLRGDGTGVCVAILSVDGAAPTAVKSQATPCELKNGPVLLTYRAVNGSDPVYPSSYFTRVADVPSRLRLRSSTFDQLNVPSYKLATGGRRAFPVSAANL